MTDLARATQKAREFRQREQAILDSAQALFMEQGEDKVTVEMIADKVGIGKGTIYKHFETKNEIYLLLMIRYEEELADLFRRIDISEDKQSLVREYFTFRVQDADKYLLFDRLESKMVADNAVPELVENCMPFVNPIWKSSARWCKCKLTLANWPMLILPIILPRRGPWHMVHRH